MSAAADDIRHESGERDGTFYIERDGRRIAQLTYRMAGADAMVDHTWVDPSLRGRGDALRLVDAAVEWARREHVKLVPACSYVRAVFARTPAYADVRKT
jgi:predicted GNAT family acetyltransferase